MSRPLHSWTGSCSSYETGSWNRFQKSVGTLESPANHDRCAGPRALGKELRSAAQQRLGLGADPADQVGGRLNGADQVDALASEDRSDVDVAFVTGPPVGRRLFRQRSLEFGFPAVPAIDESVAQGTRDVWLRPGVEVTNDV